MSPHSQNVKLMREAYQIVRRTEAQLLRAMIVREIRKQAKIENLSLPISFFEAVAEGLIANGMPGPVTSYCAEA